MACQGLAETDLALTSPVAAYRRLAALDGRDPLGLYGPEQGEGTVRAFELEAESEVYAPIAGKMVECAYHTSDNAYCTGLVLINGGMMVTLALPVSYIPEGAAAAGAQVCTGCAEVLGQSRSSTATSTRSVNPPTRSSAGGG